MAPFTGGHRPPPAARSCGRSAPPPRSSARRRGRGRSPRTRSGGARAGRGHGRSRRRTAPWRAGRAAARSRRRWSPEPDHGLDGEIERRGDETRLPRLRGQPTRLRLVGWIGLDFETEQQASETEAYVAAFHGDAVAVDPQVRVGEPCAGGEAGEGDGQARGGRGDEEVFGTPGGGVAALEDRW